jgi:hypothetical protein
MNVNEILKHAPNVIIYAPILIIPLFSLIPLLVFGLDFARREEDRSMAKTLYTTGIILTLLGTFFSYEYIIREKKVHTWYDDYILPYYHSLPTKDCVVTNTSVIEHYDKEQLAMYVTYIDNGVKKTYEGVVSIKFDPSLKQKKITFKEMKKSFPYDVSKGLYDVVLYTNDFPSFSTYDKDKSYDANFIRWDDSFIVYGIIVMILNGAGVVLCMLIFSSLLLTERRESRRTRELNIPLRQNVQDDIHHDIYIQQQNKRTIR